MSDALLAVRDLRVDFHGHRRVRAVDGLDYELERGRTLAIVGESGSGKTVSARAIMGLLPSTAAVSGSICFEGAELVGLSEGQLQRHRGRDIAMVFQDPARSLNPTKRIGVQITEAIHLHEDVPAPRRTTAPSSCWSSCGCPPPRGASTSIPTSCRAACASASSSPSRWRRDRGC